MMKYGIAILSALAITFFCFSSEAFPSDGYPDGGEPSYMEPFADPQPVYKYDWAFGTGIAKQAEDGKWYNTVLSSHVGQSQGDGTGYTSEAQCYWTSISGQLNGFSLTNDIGDWIDAIGSGRAVIRYSIREDYGATIDNSDIIELGDDEVETLVKHGLGVADSLGLTPGSDFFNVGRDNITALEWKTDFDDENLIYDHANSISDATPSYSQGNVGVYVDRNMDDENVYMTFGARAELDEDLLILTGTTRADKFWNGTNNGYYAGTTYYIDPLTYDPSATETLLAPTFDGTNWYIPVTVSSTQYDLRMDKAYDAGTYADPNSCGAVIQWYDDYDLYLAGAGITNPGGYGVSGRYVLERDEFLHTGLGTGFAHHADVCWESRTYQPIGNADGPTSPYDWLYDASGDMYVPTNGSGSGGDTESERAFKLIANHPFWVDDDTSAELEHSYPDNEEFKIWQNQVVNYGVVPYGVEGVVERGLFVDSWKLAGLMLGMDFWNVNPDYAWSPELGAVAERIWAVDLVDIDWFEKVPVWTWDSVANQWVLPDHYDKYDSAVIDSLHVWDWINVYTDTPVAGYDALNNFMRYVFDIDAVVVEDVDDDGVFDIGEDYVLFSVVDDGLYSKYQQWGTTIDDDVHAYFAGQYFDGDTIFLYDGTSVTTFFDAEAGIFFGNPISTDTGFGTGQTLWSMYDMYDLEALDIGIIPEPSTLLLFAPALFGIAGVVLKRRK